MLQVKMSERAWCVNCGAQAPELFRRYSETVLKLVKCQKCGHVADKYVEYEPVIVLIDLVLLSKEACRHILLNGDFSCHWKLAILIFLLDGYRGHAVARAPAPEPPPRESSRLFESFDLFDISPEMCFYLTYLHAFLSCLVYVVVVLLLVAVMMPSRPPMMLVWKSIVLAGCSTFLMIPALMCGNPHLYWSLVVVYWFIAQVFVLHVACGTSKLLSALVVLAAALAKCHLLEGIWSPTPC